MASSKDGCSLSYKKKVKRDTENRNQDTTQNKSFYIKG
uniref:Uncharacterized protein n=1 Tax=Anguilla anguilla TaxID=7936 RepID=A0A0E9RGQ9_ANGAN